MLLQLVLIRNDALGDELLDLRLAIVLPMTRTGTAGVDDGAHHIAVARVKDDRLVSSRRAGLVDEVGR